MPHDEPESNDPPPQRTPEGDVELARDAIANGNLVKAAEFLACAFTADPAQPEWLALFDDVLTAAESADIDLLTLAPMDAEHNWYGLGAIHARVLHRLGRDKEAVELLFAVAAAQPDVPYLTWAAAWLDAAPGLASEVDYQAPVQAMLTIVDRLPGAQADNPHAARVIRPMLPALEAMYEAHAHGDLASLYSMMLRKVGEFESALSVAMRAFNDSPSFASATSVGLIHRECGRVDDAVEWFQRSIDLDTGDKAASKLEIADMLMEHDRLAQAADWYRDVLRRDPRHSWARPSLLAVKYMMSRSDEDREKFERWVRQNPDNDRARWLHDNLFEPVPWVDYLPYPAEATLNIVRHFWQEWREAGSPHDAKELSRMTAMTVTNLESPGALLAYEVFHRMLGSDAPPFEVSASRIPTPDPRVPKGEVAFVLWRYDGGSGGDGDGTRPTKALDPPGEDIAEVVAELADRRFHLEAWARQAAGLAPRVPPERAMELVACMVHPPDMPDEAPPWLWVQHVQTAAALLIAHLDTGWIDSQRRRLLTSIARGPADWSVLAALVAIAWITRHDLEAAEEFPQLLKELWAARPTDAPCVTDYAVACHLSAVPGLDAELATELREFRELMESPPDHDGDDDDDDDGHDDDDE
ncbi:MAG: tetratricopeptide repeat protein [Planctomycetota bacterium]